MENLYFKNRAEYSDYLSEHVVERLGEPGREGICSLMDNGYVVKSLYSEYYPKFALQFKDFDFKSLIFAKCGAIIGEYVVGLFMNYAPGKMLSEEKPVNQDLLVLGNQLQVVTNDIDRASEKGMLARDFHCGNIIYDGEAFRIIDTLPYLLLPKGIFKKENYYEIMNKIYEFLLGELLKDKRVYDELSFWGKLDYLRNPKEYLLLLKKFIEELVEKEINTLGEAEQALKLKR